ncbi:MAG: isoform [Herbinix sp.]|jgi:pimeloyl-ACP methyl ester carboxylesterase|nr:isoform [Herbinix sp.]
MGIFTLVLLLTLEMFFLVWSIATRDNHREEKGITSIALLTLFGLLLVTGVFEWSFRYVALLLVLVIKAIIGAVILVRKKDKEYRLRKNILYFVRNGVVYAFALFLAILCPQYQPPKTTGNLEVVTTKYTWIDNNRKDEFSQSGENRALTVEFWYPENADMTYPLVVFSHGAFGFSGSNYSTFAELASNGYVVASIGHTYQAFFTMDTSGKVTIVNNDFISKAIEISGSNGTNNKEEVYNITREWMKLRTADENFVINTILEECDNDKTDTLFSIINTQKIGLMGHSLGGATSAQIGRERDDIDAVIVLDGTMLGEEIAFENDTVVLNDTPYPIPLLNVYAEDHYTNSKELDGDNYNNFYATQNAICAYETVIRNAGHLNFTDLPLFSPVLAGMLGVGTVDARYCIETMNEVVLEFFNCYLKDTGVPKIEKEY